MPDLVARSHSPLPSLFSLSHNSLSLLSLLSLTGDAAHPMTTHRGLGANTAFEDAHDLVLHLEKALTYTTTQSPSSSSSSSSSSFPYLSPSALAQALTSYHENLFRRGVRAVEASLSSTNMMHMSERGSRVRNAVLWTVGSAILWKRRVERHPWVALAVLTAGGAAAYRYWVSWK